MEYNQGDIVIINNYFYIVDYCSEKYVMVKNDSEYRKSIFEFDQYDIRKPTLEEKIDFLVRNLIENS